MKLDCKKYLPFLDGINISVNRKKEILRTVWQFTESQVDIAFQMHPVQQAMSDAGKTVAASQQLRLDSESGNVKEYFNRSGKCRA